MLYAPINCTDANAQPFGPFLDGQFLSVEGNQTAALHVRLCERIFRRQSSHQTAVDARAMNFQIFGPLCKCFGFSVQGKQDVVAFVASLLTCSRPPAITGLIVAVVVWETVYGRSAWFIAHIGKKIGKSKPPFANTDATSAVIGISLVIWIGASLNHASPTDIGWRCFACAGMTMLCEPFAVEFFFQAAARPRHASRNVKKASPNQDAFRYALGSAVATAEPASLPLRGIVRPRHHGPTSKTLASYFDQVHNYTFTVNLVLSQ